MQSFLTGQCFCYLEHVLKRTHYFQNVNLPAAVGIKILAEYQYPVPLLCAGVFLCLLRRDLIGITKGTENMNFGSHAPKIGYLL